MQPESGIKTWQWIVTAIVIIALIIVGIVVLGGKKSTDTTNPDTNTPAQTDTDTSTGADRVSLTDQSPGNIVYLSSVSLQQPGFVVIHKDNAGKPGAVIGSQYFDKGINTGKITLTSPTVDGGTYYAMLHTDDGDKKFDAAKDPAVKNSQGQDIMMIFHASVNAVDGIKG